MNNGVKNPELTILLISDNDADINEVTRQLESTMGRPCHVWHCPGVVRSSGFFRTALSEVDMVLLDLDLVAADSPRDMFRQFREIVREIPIVVFTERGEHKLALLVADGTNDNITMADLGTDPSKLRNAIEFALAKAAGCRKLEKKGHDIDAARRHKGTALTNAMVETSIFLDNNITHANENLRQAGGLAVSNPGNAAEYGETLLAEAKSEAAAAIDQLNTANAGLHSEKDQTTRCMSGVYSMETDPDTSS